MGYFDRANKRLAAAGHAATAASYEMSGNLVAAKKYRDKRKKLLDQVERETEAARKRMRERYGKPGYFGPPRSVHTYRRAAAAIAAGHASPATLQKMVEGKPHAERVLKSAASSIAKSALEGIPGAKLAMVGLSIAQNIPVLKEIASVGGAFAKGLASAGEFAATLPAELVSGALGLLGDIPVLGDITDVIGTGVEAVGDVIGDIVGGAGDLLDSIF
jgi:hypothetical protein